MRSPASICALAFAIAIIWIASAMIGAISRAHGGPAANESYCVGVDPQDCPYDWTFNDGRWRYQGVPATTNEDEYVEREKPGERAQEGTGREEEARPEAEGR